MYNSFISFFASALNVSALIAASVLVLAGFTTVFFGVQPKKRKKRDTGTSAELYEKLKRENEIESNIFFARVLLAVSGVFTVIAVIAEAGFFPVADKTVFGVVLAVLVSVTATAALLTLAKDGRSKSAKNMLAAAFTIDIFLLAVMLAGDYGLILLFPVIVSVRYGDEDFSARVSAVCACAALIAGPPSVAFGLYFGNYNVSRFEIPEGGALPSGSSTVAKGLIENGIVSTRFIIEQEIIKTVFTTLVIISAGICVVLISRHGRKILGQSAELTEKKNAAERETEEARSRIMMSQLQPHFLYNSLSAIMAIDGNPPETVDALADFSRYLRGNLDSLTCSELVSFAAECEHIERYLALEKLRFGDRLNIVYDIKVTDFRVPPLCVQMSVENAVKHGIMQKPEGGTLILSTEEKSGGVLITVKDDGVGFDADGALSDGGNHVGLLSSAGRIERLTGGRTEITSVPGKGTTVTIYIPREEIL